ncbi:hypothetical protein HYY75_07840, partial [bacterium]|nr:hypothetical protein [bacterium]
MFIPEITPVTFVLGGLGSGKTEFAINLALVSSEKCGPHSVKLLDLDIVNPFFRIRKLKDELESRGIDVVAPPKRVADGDLPALSPEKWNSLENVENRVICDVGGGEIGLRPLQRIKEWAQIRESRVYFIVNPFRPGFNTVDQIGRRFQEYEEVSGFSVTHIVANPNLVEETNLESFSRGMQIVREFSARSKLPLAFGLAVPEVSKKFPASLA